MNDSFPKVIFPTPIGGPLIVKGREQLTQLGSARGVMLLKLNPGKSFINSLIKNDGNIATSIKVQYSDTTTTPVISLWEEKEILDATFLGTFDSGTTYNVNPNGVCAVSLVSNVNHRYLLISNLGVSNVWLNFTA
jgi:hypothetical protein